MSREDSHGSNRLGGEQSPYLLQHAGNPVDWYPWGGEAFDRAAAEDRPVFLSVGYSTCHWCHVMERDSFENGAVAAVLNEHFVAIKVDREERPDIDAVYMKACQAMTGSGGWPLTIIMTPDRKPFFAATFIPAEDAYGRKGLRTLLGEIAGLWKTDRARAVEFAERAVSHIAGGGRQVSAHADFDELADRAFELFLKTHDRRYGGFGGAPKFPTPHNVTFLLRYWKRTGAAEALEMARRTLDAMAAGGIRDHLGGGYHRYSTDEKWLVPHFEKMLYDQAQLAVAFVEGWQATGSRVYEDAARSALDYVLGKLTSSEGGFYSAEDADSEGVEGKFYVWSEKEIRDALKDEDEGIFRTYYGVTAGGNFEGENVLHEAVSVEETALRHGVDEARVRDALARGRARLLRIRDGRPRPFLDDKVITAWNGLMISAFALGGRAFGVGAYVEAASRAADFILFRMYRKGRLYRRWRKGHVAVPGFLDDYAFFINGLLDLYQADFDPGRIEQAETLAVEMGGLFRDAEGGGLFSAASDAEQLVARLKEAYDGAEPSGNSMAALALARLAALTSKDVYEAGAHEVVSAFAEQVREYPPAYSQMLAAAGFLTSPGPEVAIAGGAGDPLAVELLRVVNSSFLPNSTVAVAQPGRGGDVLRSRAPFAARALLVDGLPAAYVCGGGACLPPVSDAAALADVLSKL